MAFGGIGTYGVAFGTSDRVGPIVAEQVEAHTLGQLDQTLDGILDELGAPQPVEQESRALPWLVIGLGLAGGAALGAFALRRHRRRTRFTGPAPYQPSFRTQADETDTVEERAALAREDVTRLGEELGEITDYARWQAACARTRLDGTALPARRAPCFLDTGHGLSVADWSWAPPGGVERPVPRLFWVGVLVFLFAGQCSADDPADTDGSYAFESGPPAPSSRPASQALAYLDQLAVELAQPGVHVDPEVIADLALTADEAAELDRIAAESPGPVRVAVVPARKLMFDDPPPAAGESWLVFDPEELNAQVYDRVGVDGTYVLLLHASSQSAGRSFTARQYAEERPFYRVEGALNDAVDCCAPDYDRMLTRFLEEAGEETPHYLVLVLQVLAGIVTLILGWVGFQLWKGRRASKAAALPPYIGDADDDLPQRQLKVLDLVEGARQRLDDLDSVGDIEGVVSRLADARYELTVIEALRAGKPVPLRTAPCFFDPRHGPSAGDVTYTPPDRGRPRPVSACTKCQDLLLHQQVPEIRTVARVAPARREGRRPFTFVWEPTRPSGRSWGSSGGLLRDAVLRRWRQQPFPVAVRRQPGLLTSGVTIRSPSAVTLRT